MIMLFCLGLAAPDNLLSIIRMILPRANLAAQCSYIDLNLFRCPALHNTRHKQHVTFIILVKSESGVLTDLP